MAKLQVGLAAEDYQWLPDLLILDGPGDISTKSSTQFIYTNNRGDTVTVNGSGFTYSGDAATGGTMSSVVVTNGGGTLLTLDLLNDPLKNFVKSILDGDPFEAMRDLYDGADQLLGSAESDSIGGFSPGNDVIQGLDGGDWIAGDEGKDNLDGGDDGQFDILSYSQSFFDKSAKKGVVLKVKKGTVKDPWGDKDTFDNFEGYWLTKHNDKFIGGKENDEVVGLKGDDILKGGKGDYDRADYSVDADFKQGNKGINVDLKKGKIKDGFGDTDTVKSIEAVRGTAKKDVFKGDNKSNEFDGYAGKDKYDGGKGFDLLVFFSNNFKGGGSGVVVDVSKGKVLDDGYGNTEKFKGMESFAGTKFDDVFIGSKKDDQFKGEDGNDTMTGGKGADSFVFNPPPDNLTNHDIITDFNQSQGDRMALWTHDGFPQLHEMNGGLDPAQFVANAGGNPTNANQRIVYDTSTGNLWLDPDGNASSGDQVLIVTLTNKPAITVDAFEVWI
jgi:serralysin